MEDSSSPTTLAIWLSTLNALFSAITEYVAYIDLLLFIALGIFISLFIILSRLVVCYFVLSYLVFRKFNSYLLDLRIFRRIL